MRPLRRIAVCVAIGFGVVSCAGRTPAGLVAERYKAFDTVHPRPAPETRDLLVRMLNKCVVTDPASPSKAKSPSESGRQWTTRRSPSGNLVYRIVVNSESRAGTSRSAVFVFDLQQDGDQTRIRMYHPFPALAVSFNARLKRWLKGSDSCSWFG